MELRYTSEPIHTDAADCTGSRFNNTRLQGAVFSDIDLRAARFDNVTLESASIHNANLSNLTITNARLRGMTIDGIPVDELLAAHRAQTMGVTEIKAFVPAKDFALSQKFYQEIGFTMASSGGGTAYFRADNASFLLQDFYAPGCAENFMMHLLVRDLDAWWARIEAAGVVEKYGLKLWPIQTQPWRMRDFCIMDPTGVLWRIGQNID